MYFKIILVTLSVIFQFEGVEPFSVSVPPVRSVCKNMTPGHDKYKPQSSTAPYNVTTDIAQVTGGETVEGKLL